MVRAFRVSSRVPDASGGKLSFRFQLPLVCVCVCVCVCACVQSFTIVNDPSHTVYVIHPMQKKPVYPRQAGGSPTDSPAAAGGAQSRVANTHAGRHLPSHVCAATPDACDIALCVRVRV